MKTLYLQCNMGASGDMFMGALYDICENKDEFIKTMNDLGLEGVHIHAHEGQKSGVSGIYMKVHIHGEEEHSYDHNIEHSHQSDDKHGHTGHAHSNNTNNSAKGHSHVDGSIHAINQLIDKMPLTSRVKTDAKAVYNIIAAAESLVHGTTINQVHFHEVGTLDAISDVVGGCLLMELISPQQVLASPVHVGAGNVKCAHGILPVPAPATTLILKGVPVYGGQIRSELCTPTGAALLKHFVDDFANMPVMKIKCIGHGFGTKDFPVLNALRAIIGETDDSAQDIVEIVCNLDDMTGEAIGYATQLLLEHNALDVFTTPIYMKNNRPAIMLTVLSKPEDEKQLTQLILKHTTTLGVRKHICTREILKREFYKKDTMYGEITFKKATGSGIIKEKPEFKEIAKIADEKNISIDEILKNI